MATFPPSTEVGEFFRLVEFKDWRAQVLPPARSITALMRLCCVVLDPLRREFGVTTVNSGYRTPSTNAKVGGAKASHHLYGSNLTSPAADVSCATGTPEDWHRLAESLLRGSGGLGLYSSHIHVDRRRDAARWQG